MLVVTGFPYYELTREIASILGGVEVGVAEKVFPDGEFYVRILEPDKIPSNDVVVVSTTYPKQESSLLKTMLLIDAVKQNNPKRIIAVIPYIAYSRQDKVFLPGEPVSACMVLKTLKTIGLDVLVVVDIHSPKTLECFGGPAYNVLVSDLLVKAALKYLENPIVLAPDQGALERASYAARTLGLNYDFLVKSRDRVTGAITYKPKELSVKGRDVVLVDDIISTGGTIAEASRILLQQGARRVVVAATHGLLVGDALKKLKEAGVEKLILANTLLVKHEHELIEYVNITEALKPVLEKITS